jgi:hypothetical protein
MKNNNNSNSNTNNKKKLGVPKPRYAAVRTLYNWITKDHALVLYTYQTFVKVIILTLFSFLQFLIFFKKLSVQTIEKSIYIFFSLRVFPLYIDYCIFLGTFVRELVTGLFVL